MTVVPWRTAEELHALTLQALENEQCTPHARRVEHADPASPPPEAVARWVGRNGNAELLCRSCLSRWLDNALDDPDLAPQTITLFLWRNGQPVGSW